MAHAHLGIVYTSMGESNLAAASIQKAYELRGRASEAEKFFIAGSYHEQVTGNLELAQQVCETWAQTYPAAMEPHGFLSGAIYPVFGGYDKSGEHALRTVELDPEFAIGYNLLALSYIERDRLSEAEQTLRQASDHKLEIPDFFIDRYEIAFLKGDQGAMDREASQSQGVLGAEDLVKPSRLQPCLHGPLATGAKKIQGCRCNRRAVRPTGTGGLVRSRRGNSGSVVWECNGGPEERARITAESEG